MKKPVIAMISAMGSNRVIGRDNDLPWRLPADFRYFKKKTMGQTLIMGRKTYDSIRNGPLPGRRTIVITRQEGWRPGGEGAKTSDVQVAHTLDEALRLAREGMPEDGTIFIAGGGEIFRDALPLTDRIYLTRIGAAFPGDAFFPELDEGDWRVIEREPHEADAENPYPFTFETLERA
jgi:dihydrofolate reductase